MYLKFISLGSPFPWGNVLLEGSNLAMACFRHLNIVGRITPIVKTDLADYTTPEPCLQKDSEKMDS